MTDETAVWRERVAPLCNGLLIGFQEVPAGLDERPNGEENINKILLPIEVWVKRQSLDAHKL